MRSSPWGQDRHVRRLQGSLCPSDEPDLIAALRDAGVLVNGHDVGFPEHGVCGAQELPEETDLPQNRLLGGYPVENPGYNPERRPLGDVDFGVHGDGGVLLELSREVIGG